MSNPNPRTDHLIRFKPGNRANPGGKPVGTRNRLQGDFMRRLADDFERFGIYAIARMRRDDPSGYVRAVVALMPKELEVRRSLDELTDEQLDAALIAARALLACSDLRTGMGAEEGTESAAGLPTLPEAG